MPEPKGNDVQRTLAVRVSPDYHAQLAMVAQVDEMSLTDLMMKALDTYMASRRESEDFKAKVQQALEDAEAQMARTRAMLLGTLPEGAPGEAPATGRGRRKDVSADTIGFRFSGRMRCSFARIVATHSTYISRPVHTGPSSLVWLRRGRSGQPRHSCRYYRSSYSFATGRGIGRAS
jgi:hypothetical protein